MYFFFLGRGTHQNLSCCVYFFSETCGTEILLSLLVIFFDISWPALKDVFKVSSKVNIPFAEPNVVSLCFDWSGTKASISSLNFVLFPDCEARCIVGVQKPDTQTQSQLMFSILPKSFLS